jgi:hypothetical protein
MLASRVRKEQIAMQRWLLLIFSLLVGSVLIANAQTIAVDCARLSAQSSVVEKELCATPTLASLNDDIDGLSKRLKTTLTGADLEAIVDTEMPFIRERNNCQNQDASAPRYYARVRACVGRVLRERMDALTSAMSSPASIRNAVVRYEFIDGAFFRKYGTVLVGRHVHVFGCLILAPGPNPASRVHAMIQDSCANSGSSVPVLFESMDETNASFLDAKMPTSWWGGTVERRDGNILLYAVDVLGRALRPHNE